MKRIEKQPLRIMLVEDNEHDRVAFHRAFQKSQIDCKIIECTNAEEALKLLNVDISLFDLVVVDHGLPGMLGLDFCKELLNNRIPLPLVMMTGAGSEKLAIDALKTGVYDYVIKDPKKNYLDLLPVVLSEAVLKHSDRSGRIQAEEEREKIQAQLFQSQKMEAIGILAGGIAHDFNNLLTTIQGYTEMALMKLDITDPLYRSIKQINRASLRAADLTRQLLLFSRKQPMEHTPFIFNKTINNLLKMINRLIGEDVFIETYFEPEIWTLIGDEGSIEQVIMNITVNSRDAMPEGGKLTIKTENVTLGKKHCNKNADARSGKFIKTSISDTGVGMNKETMEHIFEPFYTTKGVGKGTGLGLAVAYGIVKQHEGWINVFSEPGHGTTFEVYLPAHPKKLVEKAEETVSLEEFQGSGERILLVEDEKEVREFTAEVLSNNGYFVSIASDSKDAINIFERESGYFHLILSDVVLPDESGIKLVEKLLYNRPDLRILFCSGYIDDKSQFSVIKEKGFPFLQKPYKIATLLKAVNKAVSLKRKIEN